MRQIELKDARLSLAELINEAMNGNEVIITENNRPLLRLVRIAEPIKKRTLGTAEGHVWIADDFNDSYDEWIEEWDLHNQTLNRYKF